MGKYFAAFMAALLPGSARAECLSGGCYDALLYIAIAMGVAAIAVVALVIWVIVRLVRRAKARKAANVAAAAEES